MLDKHRVTQQFSRQAHEYDTHALLQKETGDVLIEQITGHPDRILDLGCGTGTLTIELAKRYPHSYICGLDIAPGMITVAQQKALEAGNEQIEFLLGDMEYPPFPDESFDLVISNASFQWIDHLPELFTKIYGMLRPEGSFLFTTFGEHSLKELRSSCTHALGKKYVHEQTFPSPKDITRHLGSAGFEHRSVTAKTYERYYSTLKQLLLSMKNIGAGNGISTRPDTLMTRKDLKAIETRYIKEYATEQRLRATYEIVFGSGCKTETGNKRQETR